MIWVIFVLGTILRLISLNQSLWLDEAINVMAANSYSFFEMITQYAIADFHPPGWFIILWLWGKLFGYSEIAVRLPSVIFGVLTIYSVYLIGKKIVSQKLGLMAALLFAINPLHIYYSQEARMYALATLAVSINFFLFIKVIKKEKVNMIFLIFANLLVLSSDYVAYFIFPAQLAFLLLIRKKALVKKWLMALIIAVLIGIWWLPIFFAQLDVGAVAAANLPTWKFVAGSFDFKTLPLTFVKFIIGRISLADKIIYGAIMLPVCTLFAYLLYRGIKSLNNLHRKLLFSWIIIPLSLATVISLVIPVYNYFRVLFVLPAFIILIALGIFSFKFKLKYAFLAAVLVIQIFSSLVYLFNPLFQRDDWKELVNFLSTKNEPVLFESSGTLPPFNYYAKGEIDARGALKDFPAKDLSDVADLENILQGEKQVYLVEYLVDISDPQRLIQKQLTQLNFKETEINNFHGVGFVYHYKR